MIFMLFQTRRLEGASLHATDGKIGHVEECYFDDERWRVRYIVVNTGSWLLGKEVLISPYAVNKADFEEKMIYLDLTVEKIKNSPDIDTDKPISRRKQAEYHTYYGFPVYPAGMVIPMAPDAETEKEDEQIDIHLRSSHEVRGYHIKAVDGMVGHVEDFIVDEDGWHIRYLIVDTRNILPGKKVVISPKWIKNVSWAESTVTVNTEKKIIKEAPSYDISKPITREYEEKLFDYYGTVKYWLEDDSTT